MNNQSGQIGLVVLLIMTTMVTVGVGAIARSTQDLKITRQEVESTNLFNAAEAGVEKALAEIESNQISFSNGIGNGQLVIQESIVDYQVEQLREMDTVLEENQIFEIDTSTAINGDVLTIDWGQLDSCEDAASMVVKLYDTAAQEVQTFGYSKCEDRNDGFDNSGSGSINVTLTQDIDVVRIRPVYFDTDISVSVGGGTWTALPIQGYQIQSTASNRDPGSTPNVNDEKRSIQVTRFLQAPPSIFDYSLISGTSLLMN